MKKFLSILLLLSLLLSLTACHGSVERPSFAIPESFDTSRNYEITFWAKNDTNLTQVGIYKDAIAAFEKLYPNIKVKLTLYTDYGRIYNDVITNLATDTTPNVCITYPDHIATYLTGKEAVVPLDNLMADGKYGLGGSRLAFDGPGQNEIIPEFLQEGFLNGAHYALPYMRSTEACYVNRTFVEKLGYTVPDVLTWDFVWEVAEAATAKNEDGTYKLIGALDVPTRGTYKLNGQKVLIPFMYKSTDNMMIQMLQQKGAGYSNHRGEVLFNNATTREILKTVGAHGATGAFNTFKTAGYPANFLNAGQCIFAVDSTAGATWMGSDAPLVDIAEEKLVQFETEVRMVPQFDPENPTMISQGPSLCVFNKQDPQEVLAAWLFTQFLLTNEVQIAYAQTEGYVPVTSKAQNSDVYRQYLADAGKDNDLHYDIKMKATQLLLDNTENTFVTPVFNGSASLRNAAGQLIEDTRKAAKQGAQIDDAYLDDLFAEMTALYWLDQITTDNSKAPLGELPAASKALLITLAVVWVCLAAWFIAGRLKARSTR